jgi:hypothetical protein
MNVFLRRSARARAGRAAWRPVPQCAGQGTHMSARTATEVNAMMYVVDDLAGLDRLDWWLNAQRGSRRRLLLWLDAYPLGFALCDALWACWAFKGDFGRAVLGAGAVALLVTVPLVFALSGLHALRAKEMRRNPPKAWPRLSWRGFASRFLVVSIVVLAFADFADNQYGRPHPAVLTAGWLQAVLVAGYLALMLSKGHNAKQVGKKRVLLQAPAPAGTQ